MVKQILHILFDRAVVGGLAKGPVKLQNIRYYSYPEYTRVVLDLSGELKIAEKVLKGGDSGRLFFDLKNCRFAVAYPLEKKNEIQHQEPATCSGSASAGGSRRPSAWSSISTRSASTTVST